jgi:hypothetical protein
MSWVGHVLTAILVPAILWWLAKKFPSPELSKDGPSLEELAKKYRKWEVVAFVVMIALWLPVSLGIYEPLHALAGWIAENRREDADTFVFFVDGVALWVPSFLLAILISGVIATLVSKFLLKERYAEFERFGALKYRTDQRALSRTAAITVISAFLFGTMICFDAYLVASPNELRVNPFFGFERRYPYDDLSAILTAPRLKAPIGSVVERRIFVLRFKDGTSYSTNYVPDHELGERTPELLVEALLLRSGLRLTEKAVLERSDQ